MKFYKSFTRIYFICGLSIATLILLGLLYIKISRTQVQYIDEVEHTYKLLNAINELENLLLNAETGQRGYMLTKNESFKEPYLKALPRINQAFQNLEILIGDTAEAQKASLVQLKKLVGNRQEWLNKNFTLSGDEPDYIDNLLKGKFLMDKCREYMDKIKLLANIYLKEKLVKKNNSQQLNSIFFKITFLFACVICIAALGIFLNELGKRIIAQESLLTNINELRNSSNELEEITYAASHDLQEPVRKIRIFSNLLLKRIENKINEEDKEILGRIDSTTAQTHDLMHDLVIYFNLLAKDQKLTTIDINQAFKTAYDTLFEGKNVHLRIVNKLPEIVGYEQQIKNMLTQILENSLKFKHPDRDLAIKVHYELKKEVLKKYFWQNIVAKQFHQITITDNGIGFSNEYNERVFGLFQRLIKKDASKGIGLTIARRVMMNHKGYIKSRAEEGIGASFILYFPLLKNPRGG